MNTGGRWGGAITAAMFLKEFAEDTPWVHLDIAGTAWTEEAETVDRQRPVRDRGAESGGVCEGLYDVASEKPCCSRSEP